MKKLTSLLVIIFVISTTSCRKIDSCLDAGGSYDYDQCECNFNTTHPYKEQHDC